MVKVDQSIHFDHQMCRCTVKIHNKRFDDPLFIDFYRIILQKRIPKLSFLRGHFSSQIPCCSQHFYVFYNTFLHLYIIPGSMLFQPDAAANEDRAQLFPDEQIT